MRRTTIALVLLASLAGAALARRARSGAMPASPPSASATQESPLACDREALTDQERHRHFDQLGPALRKLRKTVRALPDGYEFTFAGDRATYAMLSEWVQGERVCCPFFDIALTSDREGGPVRLRLTGCEGVKQFIEIEGKAWIAEGGAK